jgi:hypothetical protein
MRAPPGGELWLLDNSTLPVRGALSISVRHPSCIIISQLS